MRSHHHLGLRCLAGRSLRSVTEAKALRACQRSRRPALSLLGY